MVENNSPIGDGLTSKERRALKRKQQFNYNNENNTEGKDNNKDETRKI